MDLFNKLAAAFGAALTPLDLLYGSLACVLAILIGVSLARKQARAFSGQVDDTHPTKTVENGHLPAVTFVDYADMRFLHLGTPAVQGSMKLSKPFDIHLEYVQRMMGWLLWADLDRVAPMQAMQLGLGAASLTKFCHTQLHMHTTAIELNPEVINTCRRWFSLPENNHKLHVQQGDAAEAARDAQWHGKIDALQVDLYDQEAACPVLDSEDFYRDCRHLLSDEGCMTVNLFGKNSNDQASIKKIAAAFGAEAVWVFKPTTAGNTIALAFKTVRQFDPKALLTQAQTIEARWALPATKWLKVLAPIHPQR